MRVNTNINYTMKKEKQVSLSILVVFIMLSFNSCKKVNPNADSLYIPASTDVTSSATLKELTDGRALYVNNCGQCHNYYLPESYSPSQWNGILSSMTPKTNLSPAEIQLVSKYVRKGK
jgi:hypothetical protein